MTSKYAQNFAQYEAQASFQKLSGGQLNFIQLTKQQSKMYIQLLSEKLMPIPMHNFVPTTNGKKAAFICRKFINQPCFICDNHIKDPQHPEWGENKPKRTFIAIGVQYESLGQRKYKIQTTDMVVDNEKAKEIIKNAPNLKYIPDGENNTKFIGVPNVGLFIANKTIDEGVAVAIAEFGDIRDILFRTSRDGEGLDTKYSIMNLGDAPVPHDAEAIVNATKMHMSVDEFIDTYIDEARYARLLGTANDSSEQEEQNVPQDEDVSVALDDTDDTDNADNDIDDAEEDIDAIIRKKYNK